MCPDKCHQSTRAVPDAVQRGVAADGLIELRSMLPPLNALCVGQRDEAVRFAWFAWFAWARPQRFGK